MSTKKLSTNLLLTIAVFMAAFLAQLRYYDVGINLSDEGLVVEGARQAELGIYQPDAFAHYSTRYMLEGRILNAFGYKLTTLRAFWSLLRAGTVAMVFWSITVLAGSSVAFPLALIALLCPGPWHKAWIGFTTMLTIVALLRFRRKPRQSTAGMAGLSAGFAFSIHPYTGALLLPAVLLGVSRSVKEGKDRWKAPLWAFGGASIAALVFAYWLLKIDFAAFFGRHWSITQSDWLGLNDLFFGFFSSHPLGVLPALAFDLMLIAIALAVYLHLRKPAWLTEGGAADIFAVAMIAAFSLPKILARHDVSHLLQNLPPFLVLFGALAGWGKQQVKKIWAKAAVVAFGIWLAFFTLTIATADDYYLGSPGIMQGRTERMDNAFAPMRVTQAEKANLEGIVQSIRQAAPNKNDPLFVAPFAPMFYAMAERPNIVPLALFDRPENLLGYSEEKILANLQQTPPEAVVLEDLVMDGRERNRLGHIIPQVTKWLDENYQPLGEFGAFKVYGRKSPTPAVNVEVALPLEEGVTE